jgi:hypothetical protein
MTTKTRNIDADEALITQMRRLRALIHSSGILTSEPRKKLVRQKFGHGELADLLGELEQLYRAPYDPEILKQVRIDWTGR